MDDMKHELPAEDFEYVYGSKGLDIHARKTGPPVQACPHMQGAAFYQLVDSGRARVCQVCERMWYCSPECQKDFWRVHQAQCVKQRTALPTSDTGLQALLDPHSMITPFASSSTMSMPQSSARIDLDVSDALLRGIPNKNALGKKAAYDQLTPALTALFGRHAPASQRLIWCDTRSQDDATKLARQHFTMLKSEIPELMKHAHTKFISTRMRGAFIFDIVIPHAGGDYLLGKERFNWITYADAQMTLCVKLQETIRAYDPAKAFVIVMYALSPDQTSAALWAWTYTERARAGHPALLDLRTRIREIVKSTQRGEKYMYSINRDQNDV